MNNINFIAFEIFVIIINAYCLTKWAIHKMPIQAL